MPCDRITAILQSIDRYKATLLDLYFSPIRVMRERMRTVSG